MSKNLKFIHITKTAGTSLENIAFKNGIEWGRYDTEYQENENLKCFWHEFFPKKSIILKKKYDWFVVVRNPYTRILSEFYCNYNKDQINIKNKTQCNHYLIHKIKNYNSNGGHFSPQYLYIDRITTIHVLKYENLQNDFKNLMSLYKYNFELDVWDNKSLYKEFTLKNFSNNLIEVIQTYYKKDFEMFNYSINLPY